MNKELQIQNNQEVWRTQLKDYITGLSWSKDAQWLCASSAAGEICVINTKTTQTYNRPEAHASGIICLAHSPQENKFISGGQDGKIRLWDTETGNTIKELQGGSHWVEHVHWSPNGKYFASASGKILRLWSAQGELLHEYIETGSSIASLCWKADSSEMAYACYGGVKMIKVEEKEPYQTLPWQNSMISLFWSPDSKFICAGTQDNCIHVWPLPYVLKSDFQMSGYPGKLRNMAWDSEAKFLATPNDAELILWKFAGKIPIGTAPLKLSGHSTKISALQFQHKGKLLASADVEGRVVLWYPESSDKPVLKWKIDNELTSLMWAPNDLQLAIGSKNGEIVIMDIRA